MESPITATHSICCTSAFLSGGLWVPCFQQISVGSSLPSWYKSGRILNFPSSSSNLRSTTLLSPCTPIHPSELFSVSGIHLLHFNKLLYAIINLREADLLLLTASPRNVLLIIFKNCFTFPSYFLNEAEHIGAILAETKEVIFKVICSYPNFLL